MLCASKPLPLAIPIPFPFPFSYRYSFRISIRMSALCRQGGYSLGEAVISFPQQFALALGRCARYGRYPIGEDGGELRHIAGIVDHGLCPGHRWPFDPW
jgi:hypothetical protein